jgi:superoxide reductase
MAEKLEVYYCEVCGNLIEVLDAGIGELTCCDEPMTLLKENSVDAAKEKHVPVIEAVEHGIKVKVGSDPHPMEASHYIMWIELVADGKAYHQFLSAGDEPEATFCIDAEKFTARAYCNKHGLWKS